MSLADRAHYYTEDKSEKMKLLFEATKKDCVWNPWDRFDHHVSVFRGLASAEKRAQIKKILEDNAKKRAKIMEPCGSTLEETRERRFAKERAAWAMKQAGFTVDHIAQTFCVSKQRIYQLISAYKAKAEFMQ